MNIQDFEEAAFQALVTDITDQIASLTRQLKMQYMRLLKLKMRASYIGADDLVTEEEREALRLLPQNVEALEREIARHQERLRKIKNA